METVPGGAAPNKKVVRATQQLRDVLSYLGSTLGLMPKVPCVPLTSKGESRHSLILICFQPEMFLPLWSCKI